MKKMYVVKINDEIIAEFETFPEAYERAHSILEENNEYPDTVVKYCAGAPFQVPAWHEFEESKPAENHVEKDLELEIHVLRRSSGMEQFTGNIVQIKKVKGE